MDNAAGDLARFLREAATQPFIYGEWDCSMFLANWVRARIGRDPAWALRNAYSDETGWRAIIDRQGGLVGTIGRLAAESGLRRLHGNELRPGALGVVRLTRRGQAGAIRTSTGRWAMKLDDSIAVGSPPVIAAWGFA